MTDLVKDLAEFKEETEEHIRTLEDEILIKRGIVIALDAVLKLAEEEHGRNRPNSLAQEESSQTATGTTSFRGFKKAPDNCCGGCSGHSDAGSEAD